MTARQLVFPSAIFTFALLTIVAGYSLAQDEETVGMSFSSRAVDQETAPTWADCRVLTDIARLSPSQ